MKKTIKFFCEVILIAILMLTAVEVSNLLTTQSIAQAGSAIPISSATKEAFEEANLPTPPEGRGQDIARDLVLGSLRYVKPIVVVIGILYLTIAGYALLAHGDEEEQVSKTRRHIAYIIIAFVIISMSEDIARIFDMEAGTLFQSPEEILNRVHLYDRQVEIFVTFAKYIIGGYAAIMILRAGIKMITGGEDEKYSKEKKSIIYSIAGLILINLGDIFVNRVFYKVDKETYSGITGIHPGVDTKAGVEQIVGLTNFAVSFLGPVALLMVIIAAVMYATAGGDDEKMNKAKRLLVTTVIAIVIIYGAFALVNTIVTGRLSEIGALAD